MDWNLALAGLAIIITVLGGQIKILASINNKFEKLEAALVSKLEYHERHDDQRFGAINDNIWMLRLRNAARDKLMPEEKEEE